MVIGGRILEALNVIRMGCDEKTLVLSHGFGADQSAWNKILPSLATNFKVIVFDMVFSGNVNPIHFAFDTYASLSAYATDLLAILDELHVDKCFYVGHSVSGMVGCIASIERPHLFEKIVLLGASPRYLNDESYEGGFERTAIDGMLSTMKSDYTAFVSSFARQVVGADDPSAIQEYSTTLGNMKPEIAFAVAQSIFDSDMRNILCEVKAPCSIIQTKNDAAVPKAVPYYMQGRLGGDMNTVHLTSSQMLIQLLNQVLGR